MSQYLTRPEAAEFIRSLGLPITKNSLTKFASTGGGPVYRMFGNRAVYLEADIVAWCDGRLRPGRSAAARTAFAVALR